MSQPTRVAIVHRDKIAGTPATHSRQSQNQVAAMVKEAVDLLGGLSSVVKPGDTVVIKPNAVWPISPDAAITTDPRVVEAVVRLVKNETQAKEVILAERTGVGRRTVDSLRVTGIQAAAERGGADRVVYLEEAERVTVTIPGAKALIGPVQLPKLVLGADVLIYLPKMKTHKQAAVSLTMKMSQGLLQWSQMIECHRTDIEQKFIDLLSVIKPNLTIIDGIWAMQGQGPGSPYARDIVKGRNLIVAGTDPVAADTVAAATMGFEPLHDVGMIRGANLAGLGVGDLEKIKVLGEKIDKVRMFFRRGTCSLVGLHPKIDVYAGGACIGCQGFTRTGLDPLLADGKRLEKVERISIIMGYKTNVPEGLVHDPPRSYVFVTGDCAAEHKGKGIFFPGCASLGVHEMIDSLDEGADAILKAFNKFHPVGDVP